MHMIQLKLVLCCCRFLFLFSCSLWSVWFFTTLFWFLFSFFAFLLSFFAFFLGKLTVKLDGTNSVTNLRLPVKSEQMLHSEDILMHAYWVMHRNRNTSHSKLYLLIFLQPLQKPLEETAVLLTVAYCSATHFLLFKQLDDEHEISMRDSWRGNRNRERIIRFSENLF